MNDEFDISYDYFNTAPIQYSTQQSHKDKKATILHNICWNHSLGEVFQALQKQQLTVTYFSEFDYSPYPCFQNAVEEASQYHINTLKHKIPMTYALKVRKIDT